MSEATYTADELKEFSRLTEKTTSRDQVTRINGRIDLGAFVKLHGKPKCDAMWTAIMDAEKARGRISRRGG